MTKEHPEDRIADANEDYENINTDWSKAYAAENKIDSEISVVKAYNRKRKLKHNKVSFQDIHHTDLPKQNTDSGSHTHRVFVELNPAALNLERKLEKADSIESAETEIFEMTSSDSLSTVAEEADSQGRSSDENDGDFTVETLKNKWSKM